MKQMSEGARTTAKSPKVMNPVSQQHKSGSSQSMDSPVDRILFLQTTIGNQAVAKLAGSGASLFAHGLTNMSLSTSRAILQRAEVNYIEKVEGEEAKKFLDKFDNSLVEINKTLTGATGKEADELREGAEQLRKLRATNKVTCWYTSGGLHYASFHSASGELRLHIYHKEAAFPGTLMHEAIHAVHAGRYPKLSSMYGDVLKAGGTTDEKIGSLLLKWKAWTEYWAYRRAVEYDNLRQCEEFHRDPHMAAMEEKDVKGSIVRVVEETGEDFKPWEWKPPASYEIKTGTTRPSRKTK